MTDEYQNTYNINNRNQYEEVAIGTEGATGAIATSFAYDQNGNLIENDKRTFTYDYQNRLIKANLKDNPAEDGAGHP
ncbi:MAG: hypothetical protein H6766_04165 [Candidatus Peribacteria bacterium]|nr:MAG: hypothetical protein H6766_04165 [Candidatus Peribacteria bacterium]